VHGLIQPLLACTQCLFFFEKTAERCLPYEIAAGLRVPRKLRRFRLNQCKLRESEVPVIVWIHYRVV
jgi:hypothetical protein